MRTQGGRVQVGELHPVIADSAAIHEELQHVRTGGESNAWDIHGVVDVPAAGAGCRQISDADSIHLEVHALVGCPVGVVHLEFVVGIRGDINGVGCPLSAVCRTHDIAAARESVDIHTTGAVIRVTRISTVGVVIRRPFAALVEVLDLDRSLNRKRGRIEWIVGR